MPQEWQSFDEVGSGRRQGRGSLGSETPRVRNGKAPSSPSTENFPPGSQEPLVQSFSPFSAWHEQTLLMLYRHTEVKAGGSDKPLWVVGPPASLGTSAARPHAVVLRSWARWMEKLWCDRWGTDSGIVDLSC